MKRDLVLVSGGAGFIGSHLTDALLGKGYGVRVLDNLSRPTHDGKLPAWFNKKAEFLQGDVRKKKDWERALEGVTYIFHLAAYMDTFADFGRYIETNVVSTALMYELIVEKNLPVKKIIAASSQSVYGEGKYRCRKHGIIYPERRSLEDLSQGRWEILCPRDARPMIPLPQKEEDRLKPIAAYGASKAALEHTIFSLGRLYEIPSVALRYSIVHGAHQSYRHYYSGALRAYAVMGLAGMPIVTHEDGAQLRDFVNVRDVVEAHLAVLESPEANFQAFNVGSGKATKIFLLATAVARLLGNPVPVSAGGHFRFATPRHSLMDVSKLKKLGWRPNYGLEENVREYIEWVKRYPEAKRYLKAVNRNMEKQKIIF
jgi:dTDP-L-rhamnose 4-epimerase